MRPSLGLFAGGPERRGFFLGLRPYATGAMAFESRPVCCWLGRRRTQNDGAHGRHAQRDRCNQSRAWLLLARTGALCCPVAAEFLRVGIDQLCIMPRAGRSQSGRSTGAKCTPR